MYDEDPTLDFWQQQYDAGTTGWDRGEVHPAMVQWMKTGDLSPCRIVVPGCGRGHEVFHLCQNGFDVTAIDYAPAPIEFLRSKMDEAGLNADLQQIDLFEFVPNTPQDAVYEQTCLCAIAPEHRQPYEQQVFRWLRPGGKLFLLMMQTSTETGPPFHCDPKEIKQLFTAERWQWPTTIEERFVHPSGQIFELSVILERK